MKKSTIFYPLFFLFALHILSLPAANLTVVAFRGEAACVIVSSSSVTTTWDTGESFDLGSTPISIGELNLILYNNTGETSHNLEIYSEYFDGVNNQYVIKNGFATIKLEVSRNFDFNGNTTAFTVINPTSNPFALLSSSASLQSSYTMKFSMVGSPSNLYRDGEYRSSITIRFIGS
jgi:hypothetical protein